ncbi:MAG TPA: hypothetical protein VF002_10610 [Gaiellaceae bacterium]
MYGLTRGTVTLIAAALTGVLIWIATHINVHTQGGYWAVYGLIAAGGLVMALSQLVGGWTKWGVPRISLGVFLWAFVPVVIVGLWILVYNLPEATWLRDHVHRWSKDIHVRNLTHRLGTYRDVVAFGIGLVLGFSFDTAGPIAPGARRGAAVPPAGTTVADRTAPPPARGPAGPPAAEPPPREGPPG